MSASASAPLAAPEHEFEAQFGLPERLPAGEHILWQGQPSAMLVATRIFHLPGLAAYFALMLAWHVAAGWHDGEGLAAALRNTLMPALLSVVALALLALLARMTARTTVYTLTDRRVVMRIGIVLTVTYNLPLRCIDAAHLVRMPRGGGEIALKLRGDTRIAYLHLWPHARPWQLREPQPMLRALANGQRVASLLVAAWSAANDEAARKAPAEPHSSMASARPALRADTATALDAA